jgi:peptide/nickel transport system substrate-binding protein
MGQGSGYWDTFAMTRLARRRLLCAAGAGIAGLAAASALSCGQRAAPNKSSSASGSGPTGQPVTGGVYNFYQPTNPPTLDPQRTTSYFTMQPASAPYSRIFGLKAGADPQLSESAETEPDLGVSAESPDGLTWTIKLRTDVKFQNVAPVSGHALDTTDIKGSWVRALDKANPNVGELDMLDASQIETPAPDTMIFKLNYPYAAFPKILAGPKYGWILPREAVSGAIDPAKVMIGSGPFVLDNYTPDVALTFKRNPDWFQKGRPYLDGVRYAILPDTAAQLAQFAGGNLDELDSIAGTNLDTAKKQNPKATFFQADSNQQNALVGQMGEPSSPWVDVRVRHAISMMIDRNAISASVFSGHAAPTGILPPKFGKWALKPQDYDANTAQYYKYDPATAKKMLSDAGVSASPFAKLIYTSNGYVQPYSTLAETVNSMLNAQGVKTNLINVDYNKDYVAGGKGIHYGAFDKDALVFALAGDGYVDVDQILFAFYNSKSTRKNTPINDPTLDSMQTKARSILKDDDRLKAYLDIQKYLAEKMYFISGWPEEPRYRLVQPWVKNYLFWANYSFFTDSYAKLWLQKS